MRIVAAGGADITITSPLQSAGADALTNSTSGIPTYDLLSGFNGATWDRLRALGDDADGVATASLGRFLALARLSGYNGATWDRLYSEGNDRDAITNSTLGNLQTLGFQHVYNGASWDRATLLTDASDAVATDTSFGQGGITRNTVFNGATWDRQRTLGTAALDGLGQASVSPAVPGAGVVQSIIDQTATNTTTRFTIVTPASGKRIRIISAQFINDGAATPTDELYFGTGATLLSNPASAIAIWQNHNAQANDALRSWPDGGGPVGAVDAVLSGRTLADISSAGWYLIQWREE